MSDDELTTLTSYIAYGIREIIGHGVKRYDVELGDAVKITVYSVGKVIRIDITNLHKTSDGTG